MGPAEKLARGFGAVDELPQPRDRLLGLARVAVVDPERTLTAVLARFGHIRAELLHNEPNPARSELCDPVARLGVGALIVVRAQKAVCELGRRRDYADAPFLHSSNK
jgi:hypothetical protein